MLFVRWRNRVTRRDFFYLFSVAIAAYAALGSAPVYAVISSNVTVNAAIPCATKSPLGLGVHTSPYYNSMSNANPTTGSKKPG